MNFMDHLRKMTEDELIEALIRCDPSILPLVKTEWNRRHPEDPVNIAKMFRQQADRFEGK